MQSVLDTPSLAGQPLLAQGGAAVARETKTRLLTIIAHVVRGAELGLVSPASPSYAEGGAGARDYARVRGRDAQW